MGTKEFEQLHVTRERLTAAHYLATSWVLDNLPEQRGRLLDFGSRSSILPGLASNRGWLVTALDRGPRIIDLQATAAVSLGIKMTWHPVWWSQSETSVLPLSVSLPFDCIAAVWALQHNFPIAAQTQLAKSLAALVAPGGRLLIVGSFHPSITREDHARQDPQIILSGAAWTTEILEPMGLLTGPMLLTETKFFNYKHGTTHGDWCDRELANAICVRLERPK